MSVIVPVYGVEQYIRQCAVSLFEQTLRDVEYIFINDCTPDRSMEVLAEVIRQYPHREEGIRVIQMPTNRGISAVRTLGLEQARGEYVIYCDSDDWVEIDMYEKMYETAKAEDADVVICNLLFSYPGREIKEPDCHSTGTGLDDITNIYRRPTKPHTYTWNKLVRRSLAQDIGFCHIEGCNMWEDVNYMLRVLYKAQRIVKIDDYFCHYRQNPTSLCYTIGSTRAAFEMRKQVVRSLEEYFDSEGVAEQMRLTLSYYKMIAKAPLLSRKTLKEWRREFAEAHADIDSLTSLTGAERKRMKRAIKSPAAFIAIDMAVEVKSRVLNFGKKIGRNLLKAKR